eukprot:5268667-Amphidinium_carterae.1
MTTFHESRTSSRVSMALLPTLGSCTVWAFVVLSYAFTVRRMRPFKKQSGQTKRTDEQNHCHSGGGPLSAMAAQAYQLAQ